MKNRRTIYTIYSLLTTLCVIFTLNVNAQKIKKGIVYYDGTASGKVQGKVSLFKKAELTFTSMEDAPLLSVNEQSHHLGNPLYESYKWLAIKFEDSGKEMKLNFPIRCGSEKCILETLEKDAGIQFRGLPVADQDAIIAKYDYSGFIQSDSIAKRKEERILSQKLQGNFIARNLRSEILTLPLRDPEPGLPNSIAYLVKQDDKAIGRLVKVTKGDVMNPTFEYTVFEKHAESNENIQAAHVTVKSPTGVPEVRAFTFVDNKWHRFHLSTKMIEKEVVKFLVDNHYL